METVKDSCKVISVYTNTDGQTGTEYALNIAAALTKVANTKVVFIDMAITSKVSRPKISPDIGIDVVNSELFEKEHLAGIRNNYQYAIIALPKEINESLYEMFFYSGTIHFFVDSTKDRLKKVHTFLENLVKEGLEDLYKKIKVVVYRLNIFDRLTVEEMTWLLRKDVWAIVPEPGILDILIDSNGVPLVLRDQESLYAKAILRIAKSESGKLIGLALGSGSAFGLAHIGVLKVLEQNNIPIDIISGSSIGALIGTMCGLAFPSDKMEHIARRLKNKLNIMRLLDFTVPISGLLAGKRLKRFLRNIFGQKTFEDLQIPVKIIVYDLANRETIAIEKGSLVDAIYMSISVPGIFEPKIKEERMLIDGGVSDPVPVNILLKEGIKKLIAVNVLPGPEDIYKRNMLLKNKMKDEENLMQQGLLFIKTELFIKRFFRKLFTPNIFDVIMTSMQSLEYVLAENSCKKANVSLHPVLVTASSIDFHLVDSFVKIGEEEAARHIKQIKEMVEK